jgi:hypothetical protein
VTIYDVGDPIPFTKVVTVNGVPTDVDMTGTITAPDGSTTAATITHAAPGSYATSPVAAMPGNYLIRWSWSGTAVGVDEDQAYVEPAGFRIISVTDAKDHINKTMTYAGDDNELRDFIETAGELCDKLAGPTVNRTVVEYHSGPAREIFLTAWPVVSITEIVETWPGGPNYVLNQLPDLGVNAGTGYDFTFDPNMGAITRRVNNWAYTFPPGTNNIKVTAMVGRRQPWPARIRMAAKEEVAYLWRTSQTGRGAGRPGAGANPVDKTVTVAGYGAVPVRVVEMLSGLRPPLAGA